VDTPQTQPPAALDHWGSEIDVETVKGVPYRMYTQRPREMKTVLTLARRWGTRPHIIQGTRVVTFNDLLRAVAEKSRLLADHGISRGDRALLLGWNGPDWIINFWACQQIGAVPALANAWWSAVEVSEALDLLDPAITLADSFGATKVPEPRRLGPWETHSIDATVSGIEADRTVPKDENDPTVIIFTSGTAGRPKAVELSHRALLANLQMLLNLTHRLPQDVKDDSGEVILHTGPLFHVGGPQMLLRSLAIGNTIVLPSSRFDPAEAIDLIGKFQITRWAAVSTMVSRVLDDPTVKTKDLSSLKALTLGGAPIHAELLKRIEEILPSVQAGVPTGYGLTENCGQATAASGRDSKNHPGSAGKPLPCVELSFVPVLDAPDPEILVRSPTQMTRYVGVDESPIDAEGWLHTGDLGHLDEGGRLWITGRSKDLIIRGGENIAPMAVERALGAIAGVVESAVVGIPHPDLGEEIFAFVVVADPGLSDAYLAGQLKGHLASFAIPSVWHLQSEPLPTNQTGKVDKTALATLARELTPRTPA